MIFIKKSTLPCVWIELTTLLVIGTNCIGRCKSNSKIQCLSTEVKSTTQLHARGRFTLTCMLEAVLHSFYGMSYDNY